MKRTKQKAAPVCPGCKGSNFSEPWLVPAKSGTNTEPWPHVQCLDCGTVSYEMLTEGWSTRGFCGNPKEHAPADSGNRG